MECKRGNNVATHSTELKNLYVGVMAHPRHDTALDACAAAVLGHQRSGVIALESQAMKRGHAEALMPLSHA